MKAEERGPTEQLSEVFIIEDSIKRHGKGRFLLVGQDGNAFCVIGRVQKALRRAGWSAKAIEKVREDMTSGDYNHLLRVAMGLQHPCMERAEALAAEACQLQAQAEEPMREALDDDYGDTDY
jgi:hypothetical protein